MDEKEYKGYTPDYIDRLLPNQIFVFGINEKCSRIRAAFLPEVDSTLLEQYIISGKSGEVKKISLPRDLVSWE